MKMHRIGVAVFALTGIATLAACHGSPPSDKQLTLLLHSERARANDVDAPLDVAAVDCLRSWSGDIELTATLPPALLSDVAKAACKTRFDGWIADAARNPDQIAFERVSKPATVRRAVALMNEHRGNIAQAPAGTDRAPRALAPQAKPPMPAELPMPAASMQEPPDIGAAAKRLDELDQLCQQAKKLAADAATPERVARYGNHCAQRVEQLRTRLGEMQQETSDAPKRVFVMAVDSALLNGNRIMQGPAAAPPPAN